MVFWTSWSLYNYLENFWLGNTIDLTKVSIFAVLKSKELGTYVYDNEFFEEEYQGEYDYNNDNYINDVKISDDLDLNKKIDLKQKSYKSMVEMYVEDEVNDFKDIRKSLGESMGWDKSELEIHNLIRFKRYIYSVGFNRIFSNILGVC